MTIDKIVDNIKTSIVRKYGAQVRIIEKSYLLELLEPHYSSKNNGNGSFDILKGWSIKGKRFPVTYLIVKTVYSIIIGFVSLFYLICSFINWLITGKRSDLRTSPRFNFVVFLFFIVCDIVLIVAILVFFIKGVLFFNPNNHINEKGAVAMYQPCGKEQYLFLFNTAICWANTGIQVMEGDHVQITASGSFFSNIGEQADAALKNRRTRYPRTSVSRDLRRDPLAQKTRKILIYNNKDAFFGSLLVQIKQDYKEYDYSSEKGTIRQINDTLNNKIASFTAWTSGTISLAINDIYLSDSVICQLKKDSAEYVKHLKFDSVAFKTFDEIKLKGKRRDMWFDDNVGEVLINMTISRAHIQNTTYKTSIMPKVFRFLDNTVDSDRFGHRLLLCLLIFVVFLVIDFSIGFVLNKK